MWFKHRAWIPVAWLLCFGNLAAVWFAARPAGVRSLLSYSKNVGLSGELRLRPSRSSSAADEMASALTGSCGTTVGSATGSGGSGGRADVEGAGAAVGGGGMGRATGGLLPPQAANPAHVSIRSRKNAPLASARLIGIPHQAAEQRRPESSISTNPVESCCPFS